MLGRYSILTLIHQRRSWHLPVRIKRSSFGDWPMVALIKCLKSTRRLRRSGNSALAANTLLRQQDSRRLLFGTGDREPWQYQAYSPIQVLVGSFSPAMARIS